MQTFKYMSPRRPTYLFNAPKNVEEALPIARSQFLGTTYGRGSLGEIKKGDKILIVTYDDQDKIVLDAIVSLMKEKGAEVDVKFKSDLGVHLEKRSAADGWREITEVVPGRTQGDFYLEVLERGKETKEYLSKHPEVTILYQGEAGEPHIRKHVSSKLRVGWYFRSMEYFLSRVNTFPGEVWRLIEDKILDILGMACEVRITDPEGTDISFSVPEETAKLWSKLARLVNHLFMYPPMAFRIPPGLPTLEEFTKYSAPVFASTNGVIASCSTHQGFFPHTKIHIRKGLVREVKGDNKYAELWREVLKKYGNVQYPGYPEPGFSYLTDVALATNPKGFRSQEIWSTYNLITNAYERNRAGVIHCGFGCEHQDPKFTDFVKKNNVPGFHWSHVHLFFPTYAVKLRASTTWVKIVDKGWLTVLDDPDVRRVTSSFGDPDDLLSYDWVPAIPGINYPGDYWKDYANDPVPWIKRDMNGEFCKSTP